MATPIKDTPTLYGKDAKRFLEGRKAPKDPEKIRIERERILTNYNLLKQADKKSLGICEGFENLSIKVLQFKEGKYHIAFSPTLEISGQGKTKTEALDDLKKIVRIIEDAMYG